MKFRAKANSLDQLLCVNFYRPNERNKQSSLQNNLITEFHNILSAKQINWYDGRSIGIPLPLVNDLFINPFLFINYLFNLIIISNITNVRFTFNFIFFNFFFYLI